MATAQAEQPPDWHSTHLWKMPDWIEPVLIVAILVAATVFTRRKHYSIWRGSSYRSEPTRYVRLASSPAHAPEPPLRGSSESETLTALPTVSSALAHAQPPVIACKFRRVCDVWTVRTPGSSHFARNFHSRILVKYPFLVEIFYGVINFIFYRLTVGVAQIRYGHDRKLWDIAEAHGLAILELEAAVSGTEDVIGTDRWAEWRIQQWFLDGVDAGSLRGFWLAILDLGYSVLCIPTTVGFVAFYYWYAPSFARFAIVRRTLSLLNCIAFLVFLIYPTMPPRFLPPEFGFVDTVNGEDAQSVWMRGRFVSRLAAMPSMHFAYAFCIGCAFVHESGFLKDYFSRGSEASDGGVMPSRRHGDDENDGEDNDEFTEYNDDGETVRTPLPSAFARDRNVVIRCLFLCLGLFYPCWVLLTIVATANHYFLDAFVAAICVVIAFLCNSVLLNLLPLEDWLLWAWRLEKPQPTTGLHRQRVDNRA